MAGGFLTPDTQNALLQASQTQAGQSNKSLRDAKNAQAIEKAAQEFEAIFISEMMKPMFEGIEAEAPFHGGHGEEIFKSMMLSEYGKLMSQTGSIGVSSSVKDMMIKMQDEANRPAPQQAVSMNGEVLAGMTPQELNAIEPGGNQKASTDNSSPFQNEELARILNSLTNTDSQN